MPNISLASIHAANRLLKIDMSIVGPAQIVVPFMCSFVTSSQNGTPSSELAGQCSGDIDGHVTIQFNFGCSTKVARKLAVLLHRLWVSGEVYEPLRNNHKVVSAGVESDSNSRAQPPRSGDCA